MAKTWGLTGLLMLFCFAPAWAWNGAAPNEAIFFADANFQGESLKVAVQPGQRHRLLPDLGGMDKKISSIIMGDKVKALVFTKAAFGGGVREYVYSIENQMPDDDQISSLIVCPRDEPPQGVLFIQKRLSEVKNVPQRPWNYITGKGIFFPLPEPVQALEAKVPQVTGDWEGKARYVYVSPAVELDLFAGPDFTGRSLSLPGPEGSPQAVFDLSTYGFVAVKKTDPGGIASLKVRARASGKR